MSTLRLRRQNIKTVVESFDAFPKVQESVQEEKKISSGLVGVITLLLIVWLVWLELWNYLEPKYKYRFNVDTDYDETVQLDFDITLAMPCYLIGADVMDATDTPIVNGVSVKMEPTNFELSDSEKLYWRALQRLAAKQRSKNSYSSLDSLLLSSSGLTRKLSIEHEKKAGKHSIEHSACRIYGFVRLNKVSGNFHVTAGKAINLNGAHAHLQMFAFGGEDPVSNFSHRIDRFAFGPRLFSLLNPLDGTERITLNGKALYQYYIKVVPTKLHSISGGTDTCQYSVTQLVRNVSHSEGSHGMPGVFFKYDFAPMGVEVIDGRLSLWKLFVRLFGIVGGVFATSGVISMLLSVISDLVCVYIMRIKPTTLKLSQNEILNAVMTPTDHKRGEVFST